MKVRQLLLLAIACVGAEHVPSSNDASLSTTAAVQLSTTSISTSSPAVPSSTSRISTLSSNATCPARTVNYITHTLPQQCLRTDWTRSRSGQNQTTETSASSVNSLPTSSSALQASDLGSAHASRASTDNNTASADLRPAESVSSREGTPSSSSTISTVTLSDEQTSTSTPAAQETDSLFDEPDFLSFEDWKKQNLAKVGQSGQNLGSRQIDASRRSPDINAFDTLGDENEIELDFSGFGAAIAQPGSASSEPAHDSPATTNEVDPSQISHASQALRPRDAGRTCKERTNYASFDCAATVLKSNQECKSASSILIENKDSYMLNKCSAKDKHFIVELCNDILVDTIVLANFEFFSSIFRRFKVSVSDRYPVKAEKWRDLGTFEARNTREVQAFLVENPLIWARYLRIDFLTHYGSEYYCPVSLLRVHGTTMMEEFRNQEELARGEPPEELGEATDVAVQTRQAEIIVLGETDRASQAPETSVSLLDKNETDKVSSSLETNTTTSTTPQTSKVPVGDLITTSPISMLLGPHHDTCPSDLSATTTAIITSRSSDSSLTQLTSADSSKTSAMSTTSAKSTTETTAAQADRPIDSSTILTPQTSTTIPTSTNHTHSSTVSQSIEAIGNTTNNNTMKEESVRAASSTSSLNSTKSATLSSSPQPQPTTQESFFKSISKRLQQLESNSTLSMQYIEESSRILREAFSKGEKRQLSATTTFLSNLNDTVMAELAGFRQAYDQLWQSTVIELEGQREQHHREMTALSSRLTLVVDELVWQKRMGIVQSTLLLLCLALVLFARGGSGSLEMSFMQQVKLKSQAAFRSYPGSDQNSPASGRSPVSLFRRRVWKAEPDSASPRPGSASGSNGYGGLDTPRSLDEQAAIPEITYTAHDEFSASDSESDVVE